MKFFSSFLILLGIILLTFSVYLIYQRVNPWRLSFSEYENSNRLPVYGPNYNPPTQLIIEGLKINVPIKRAKGGNGNWQSFSDAISYLSSSPIPGYEGNSVLYGHNWSNMLGNLTKAKLGEKIIVKFQDGSQKEFTVKYLQEVTPDQTAILASSKDTRITLYTCSGFLDSKRFVVVAILDT